VHFFFADWVISFSDKGPKIKITHPHVIGNTRREEFKINDALHLRSNLESPDLKVDFKIYWMIHLTISYNYSFSIMADLFKEKKNSKNQ
jgi:hypothetical protein